MIERDITFTSSGVALAGTMTRPDTAGPHPGALLITGSGPIDRNSDMKRQALGVTRDLAHAMARRGVASLRYDKRGVGDSEGTYHSTGFHDNVTDAAVALAALRSAGDISATFLVGHSEGALIATRLVASGVEAAGAVLLAGSARSGKAILRHQAVIANDSLPVPVRALLRLFRTDLHNLQAKRITKLEASTADIVRIQGIKINAKWFREFMIYDPSADLPSATVPLLAITGEKDLQVPPEDLGRMAALAGGPMTTLSPEHLTHILRRDLEEPSLKAYRRLMREPTDQALMASVADWILRTSSQPTSPETSPQGA